MMRDESTKYQKERMLKWNTSYSEMTQADTEKRLGFSMKDLRGISIARMLAEAKYKPGGDDILKTKEKVYNAILQYIETEGYPSDENSQFSEASINDLVLGIINPIISDFRRRTGRHIRLQRGKEITSIDCETGGKKEFVVMDFVSVTEEKFVLMVEAKRSSLGQAIKQCLPSMKDMGNSNGGGEVYGFATTGESWRVFKYDGKLFWRSDKIDALFDTMVEDKERWMRECAIVVDCINMALGSGGIVKEDLVV